MSSPSQLSFLPDDYLERKAQRRANAICALLFVAVMGGITSAFALSEKATRRVDDEYASVEKQYLAEAGRLEQVRQMQDKQKRMAHQAELTGSLLERVPRSTLLARITDCIPAGLSLLEFTLESKEAKAPSAEDATKKTAYERKKAARAAGAAAAEAPLAQPRHYDVTLKITGVAYNDKQVADFMSALSRNKLFADVNLPVTEEFKQGDEKLRKFQLVVTMAPNAEAGPAAAPAAAQTTSVDLKE